MTAVVSPGGRRTDATRPVTQRRGPPTSGMCSRSMPPGLQICPMSRFNTVVTCDCSGSGRFWLLGQSEGTFAHNVALDLGGTAPDRFGAREEEERLQVVYGVVGLGPPSTRQDRVHPIVAQQELSFQAVDVDGQEQ